MVRDLVPHEYFLQIPLLNADGPWQSFLKADYLVAAQHQKAHVLKKATSDNTVDNGSRKRRVPQVSLDWLPSSTTFRVIHAYFMPDPW
jgi:hypothetical protein